MPKLIQEIRDDLDFVRSHTLQPKWYKALKIFILLGFLAGYYFFFGAAKTFLFLMIFLVLSLAVHMTYRIKTNKFKQSWLDFIVVEENGKTKYKRIGAYYYSAIVFNAIISAIISQAIP